MQLVVPLSGQGLRFKSAGYDQPKPLISVNGRPMIERLLEVFPKDWPCTFVLRQEDEKSGLPELLKKLKPQAHLIFIPTHQKGPGHALKAALPILSPQEPVLVSYCDYGMRWNPEDFVQFVEQSECDMSVLCYRGFQPHYLRQSLYAYCRTDHNRILEIREKHHFTTDRENEYASCGAYYFRSTELLKEALEAQTEQNLHHEGEFYTSLTVQAQLQKNPQSRALIYEIDAFYQWGTPQDLQDFEHWERMIRTSSQVTNPQFQGTLLMTMAGQGKRMLPDFTEPKPLIPLHGSPMYLSVLKSFTSTLPKVLITLKSFSEKYPSPLQIIELDQTPHGQALSAEKALNHLPQKQNVFVTACDHNFHLSPERWLGFSNFIKDTDALVFTASAHPGADRTPHYYSYVKAPGTDFALIEDISYKKPFTKNPRNEAIVIGTFWFKRPEVLQKAIELIKAQPPDGLELSLDHAMLLLLKNGYRVRSLNVDAYMNWGDRESLKEYLHWKDELSQ